MSANKDCGFHASVKIIMADGRPKTISHVRSGDEVLCLNEEGESYSRRVFSVERKMGDLATLYPQDGFGNEVCMGIDTLLYLIEKSKPELTKTNGGYRVLWYEKGGPCVKYFSGESYATECAARYFYDTTKRSVFCISKMSVRNYLHLDTKTKLRMRCSRGRSFVGLTERKVPQDPVEYGKSLVNVYTIKETQNTNLSSSSEPQQNVNISIVGGSYTFNSFHVRFGVIKGILSELGIKKSKKYLFVKGKGEVIGEVCLLLRSIGILVGSQSKKLRIDRKSYNYVNMTIGGYYPKDKRKATSCTHSLKSTFKFKIELGDKCILFDPLFGGDYNILLEDFSIH